MATRAASERGGKKYKTFKEFYPFYLEQHSHPLTKLLHAIGTLSAFVFILFNPFLLIAGTLGVFVGLGCYSIFKSGESGGSLEMFLMMSSYFMVGTLLTGSWKVAATLPLIAYSWAWAGHFFIERNKPATFTYPVYSLLGDLVMFWGVISGKHAVS